MECVALPGCEIMPASLDAAEWQEAMCTSGGVVPSRACWRRLGREVGGRLSKQLARRASSRKLHAASSAPVVKEPAACKHEQGHAMKCSSCRHRVMVLQCETQGIPLTIIGPSVQPPPMLS
jgi:hypothetical protein